MDNTFKISSSPHVRDKRSTQSIMLDVIIALLPATVFGIINFELNAMILILTCVVSCVLFEWLYQKMMNRKVTISDLSAVVTGLLLALNLSPDVPVWMAILGSAFAIIIVKQLFGGLGFNFMNPALGARCFLLISFAGRMTSFSYDGVTTATPLAVLKNTGDLANVNVLNMFLGNIPGTIGETSVVCLLVGAAYLLIRRVIKPVIPFTYIGTFAVLIMIYAVASGRGFDLTFLAAHLCGGGLMLGAFFMATDYVTSPITPAGKVVFGVILGILTFCFRIYGGSAEGVSYAIIFSNLLVPLIERWTQPKSFGEGAELAAQGDTAGTKSKMDTKSIVIATIAIMIITVIAGFALAYVYKITKDPIAVTEQKAKEDAALAKYTKNWRHYSTTYNPVDFIEKWRAGEFVFDDEETTEEHAEDQPEPSENIEHDDIQDEEENSSEDESEAQDNTPVEEQPEQPLKPKRGALLEFDGRSQNICAWGEELGISPNTLYGRIYKMGWSIERAFTTPSRKTK